MTDIEIKLYDLCVKATEDIVGYDTVEFWISNSYDEVNEIWFSCADKDEFYNNSKKAMLARITEDGIEFGKYKLNIEFINGVSDCAFVYNKCRDMYKARKMAKIDYEDLGMRESAINEIDYEDIGE